MGTMCEASLSFATTSVLFSHETLTISDGTLTDRVQATVGTNRRQLPPLPALVTTEASVSKSNTPSEGDSGYDSIATTPQKAGPQEGLDPEVVLPYSRTLFQRKCIKLKVFDQHLSESTRNRFYDLKELFNKPLYDYVSKARVRFTAISIKLRVLGETEATAKPWIVVLCDKGISKKVKQFFNQPLVRSEYEGRDLNSDMPSFKLVVSDRPPRQIAMTCGGDLYAYNWNEAHSFDTLCGTALIVDNPGKFRMATLGGIVKVVFSEDSYTLYGMTAGHIIAQEKVGVDSLDLGSHCEEDDNEDDYDEEYLNSDTEEFELDLPPDEDVASPKSDVGADMPDDFSEWGAEISPDWMKIGYAFTPSLQIEKDKENLDWALVEMNDPSRYRPNLVTVPRGHQSHMKTDLKENFHQPKGAKADRAVFVVTSPTSVKLGILSTFSSFLLLAPGESFVETYTLTLKNDEELCSGACGSWVVDSVNYEVYGHVVASDSLKDAYVLPLAATFQQMKDQLMAQSVCLPSSSEVASFMSAAAAHPHSDNTRKVSADILTAFNSSCSSIPSHSTRGRRPMEDPTTGPAGPAGARADSSQRGLGSYAAGSASSQPSDCPDIRLAVRPSSVLSVDSTPDYYEHKPKPSSRPSSTRSAPDTPYEILPPPFVLPLPLETLSNASTALNTDRRRPLGPSGSTSSLSNVGHWLLNRIISIRFPRGSKRRSFTPISGNYRRPHPLRRRPGAAASQLHP